jgi:hypothetical protein
MANYRVTSVLADVGKRNPRTGSGLGTGNPPPSHRLA